MRGLKQIIEDYSSIKRKAGDLAWNKLSSPRDRFGWSRHPFDIRLADNEVDLVVTFYDCHEGDQSKEIVVAHTELQTA